MHTADVPVENYKLDKIKKLKEEHDAEDQLELFGCNKGRLEPSITDPFGGHDAPLGDGENCCDCSSRPLERDEHNVNPSEAGETFGALS